MTSDWAMFAVQRLCGRGRDDGTEALRVQYTAETAPLEDVGTMVEWLCGGLC